MADLKTSLPQWPAIPDTATLLVPGVDLVIAENFNGVLALAPIVEQNLGLGIKGSRANLTDRLLVSLAQNGAWPSGQAYPTVPPPLNGQPFWKDGCSSPGCFSGFTGQWVELGSSRTAKGIAFSTTGSVIMTAGNLFLTGDRLHIDTGLIKTGGGNASQIIVIVKINATDTVANFTFNAIGPGPTVDQGVSVGVDLVYDDVTGKVNVYSNYSLTLPQDYTILNQLIQPVTFVKTALFHTIDVTATSTGAGAVVTQKPLVLTIFPNG